MAVMHCFSSGKSLANTAIELGFYLSMSGIITFPKSNELCDIFSSVPIDKILVETDSPIFRQSLLGEKETNRLILLIL